MTAEELDAFLATTKVAQVAAVGHGGLTARRGHIVSADGARIVLDLQPPERSFRLEQDDRVCVITDRYPDHDAIQGAVLHGRARWVGSDARMDVLVERVVSFDFRKTSA